MIKHLTHDELQAGPDEIRQSPKDFGVVHQIVIRPDVDQREILEKGELNRVPLSL